MARDGCYAGAAAVTLPASLRVRLWQRVQQAKSGKPARLVPTAVAGADVEWVKPGITGKVRFLRGEHKLRHATARSIGLCAGATAKR